MILAIGLDAAEDTLLRRLVADGEMPALAEIAAAGRWHHVDSSSALTPDGVWPSFLSGRPSEEHGRYGLWQWDPRSMRMLPCPIVGVPPIWAGMTPRPTLGWFDVPRTRFAGHTGGFEVAGWGQHDPTAPLRTDEVGERAVAGSRHPFLRGWMTPRDPTDTRRLEAFARLCIEGAQMRGAAVEHALRDAHPELAVVVFTEIHHCSHQLWHTIAPDPHLHADILEAGRVVSPALLDVYRAVDTEIGRIVRALPSGATVVAFAVHGMRPARGMARILERVLPESGHASLLAGGKQSGAAQALSAVKRLAPTAVKRAWYGLAPTRLTASVAAANALPAHRWDRTRAFSLASDQHGFLRVNLRGRESEGIVSPADYEPLIDELEELVRGLVDAAGRPLVRDVVRPAGDPATRAMPDLVVHWTDAVFAPDVQPVAGAPPAPAAYPYWVGQHTDAGWLLAQPEAFDTDPSGIPLTALQKALLDAALRRR